MDDLPEALKRLANRLDNLERRVYALEHSVQAAVQLPAFKTDHLPPARTVEASALAPEAGIFTVLGRAMLGMAGAFLLRAVAESSLLPLPAVAALAIAYAILWLVWATRTNAGAWFASATYICTSALILAPMLWELTLRFKVLPPAVTAGVLGAFVIAASALAWKRKVTPVFWVANLTAAAAAIALAIVTRELAPFIAVLLLIVLICEYAAGQNRALGVRPLMALSADLGVWALIYIYSGSPDTRSTYPVMGTAELLAPGFILFLIFGASVIFRTAVRGKTITIFETAQTMIAFVLAACCLLYFGPRGSATVLGVFCLILSAASYAAVFAIFDRAPERRNSQVFSAWSAALFLAGGWLCLPPAWWLACLGVASIAATVLGVRLKRRTLEFHGMVYLLAAAAASGLLEYVFSALAGTLPGAPAWGVYFAAACAVLCYAVVKPGQIESWKRQVLPVVSASLAIVAAAAILVEALTVLVALRIVPGPHHLAFLRTLTLCASALALAFSGAHWRRRELTRIGYALLVLVAVKLAFEDLRLGHMEFIAASIFLYAVTLIAVPHIARVKQKT